MEPIINLIGSVEEDQDIDLNGDDHSLGANCGGGVSCCVACCSVPNVITKWICT